MNRAVKPSIYLPVSAGCHINDVMNYNGKDNDGKLVSAGCHINDVMNSLI